MRKFGGRISSRSPHLEPLQLSTNAKITNFIQLTGLTVLITLSGTTLAQPDPIQIPLKHVVSDGDGTDPDMLGIVVGVNDGPARLLELDTGSDALNFQSETAIAGVELAPGAKPELYGYGDGSYGYWQQRVQFEKIAFYNPASPSKPVAVLGGGHTANQVLDMVYSKSYHAFSEKKVSREPVGNDDGTPLFADLDYRKKMQSGKPAEDGAFYGTFGAGDHIGKEIRSSPLGGRTRSGYVVAANANLTTIDTHGCAPCLTLHLTPSIRSQFTALTPWGKLDYDDRNFQKTFPQSGANASNDYEGSYSYKISFGPGTKKHAVDLRSPILFDTGTAEFIYLSATEVLKKLRAKGFSLKEHGDDEVDFTIRGSAHGYDNIDFSSIDIFRLDNEDDGDGITIGLPFFQQNSVLFDLENRITGYSPFYVTSTNFNTDLGDPSAIPLSQVSHKMGSAGWLGLAGDIHGSGDLTIAKDAVVRMTGKNTYSGATIIAADGHLYLAGPGDISHSSRIEVNGVLNMEQSGNYLKSWGETGLNGDVTVRNLNGTGDVFLGKHRVVLTAAAGKFEGDISDMGDDGKSMGGGLAIKAGTLTLAGENYFSGPTEVFAGSELKITGSLSGDVVVSGALFVDGEVSGTVTVKSGGALSGSGKVGQVVSEPGGTNQLKTAAIKN